MLKLSAIFLKIFKKFDEIAFSTDYDFAANVYQSRCVPLSANFGPSFEDDAANGAGGERLKVTSVHLLDARHLLPAVDSGAGRRKTFQEPVEAREVGDEPVGVGLWLGTASYEHFLYFLKYTPELTIVKLRSRSRSSPGPLLVHSRSILIHSNLFQFKIR